jgi:hypothetical protein
MSAPADTLIIPTDRGPLLLNPTPVLRWYIVRPRWRRAQPPKLQQLWRERDTGNPYWRDVPTEVGR